MSNVEIAPSRRKGARTGTFLPSGELSDGTARFRGRLRLGDGSRSERFDLPQGLNEERARAWLASMQAQEDLRGELLEAKRATARTRARSERKPCDGEAADAWHERFLASRGEGPSSHPHYRWTKWISPVIGSIPMTRVSSDDVERVRDKLDDAVRERVLKGQAFGI